MTGEKDPRDVMQAEHDAQLSEHSAFRAPAEMPGVEEIAGVVASVMNRDNHALALYTARQIAALFAPILAEKERDNRQLKLEVAEERETSRISIYGWRDKANEMEARALAAEAALAKAVEALEPFARAERALGSEPGSDRTFRLETDTGYRGIPREAFRRARTAIEGARGEKPRS